MIDPSTGRRTLVRAGIVSAWAAPVVLASVPAQAAVCSAVTSLQATIVNGSLVAHADGMTTIQITVCNKGPNQTIKLMSTISGGTSVNPSNYTVGDWPTGLASGPGATSITVEAPADKQLAVNQCVTYDIAFTLKNPNGGGLLVAFTFNPGCGSPVQVQQFIQYPSS